MGTDGRDYHAVAPGVYARLATWFPDGKRFAFDSDEGIFLIDANGMHQRRLMKDGNGPAWSPDGREIVFVRTDPRVEGIWLMNVDCPCRNHAKAHRPARRSPQTRVRQGPCRTGQGHSSIDRHSLREVERIRAGGQHSNREGNV